MIEYITKEGTKVALSPEQYLKILIESKSQNTDDASALFTIIAKEIDKAKKIIVTTQNGMIEYNALINNGTILLDLELYDRTGYTSIKGNPLPMNDTPHFLFRVWQLRESTQELDNETKEYNLMEIENFTNDSSFYLSTYVPYDEEEEDIKPTSIYKSNEYGDTQITFSNTNEKPQKIKTVVLLKVIEEAFNDLTMLEFIFKGNNWNNMPVGIRNRIKELAIPKTTSLPTSKK